MIMSFSTEAFLDALVKEKLRESNILTGIVKQPEDKQFLPFSPGKSCQLWVRIPLEIIEKVDWLGKVSCLDHTYDYVQLLLKEINDPILQDFTAALRSYSDELSQSLPNSFTQLTPVQNLPVVDVLPLYQLGEDRSFASAIPPYLFGGTAFHDYVSINHGSIFHNLTSVDVQATSPGAYSVEVNDLSHRVTYRVRADNPNGGWTHLNLFQPPLFPPGDCTLRLYNEGSGIIKVAQGRVNFG